jgi:hypothetical protein
VILTNGQKYVRILFDTSGERLLDVCQLYMSPMRKEVLFLLEAKKLRVERLNVSRLNYWK